MRFISFIFLLFLGKFIFANSVMNLFIPVNYLADSTIREFENTCKCHLSQTLFNDPNEMLAKISVGATGYDVIEATSYAVEELVNMGKLQKLDKARLNGLENIDKKYLNQTFDPNNVYSIPYAYTPVFLAYNKDKMNQLGIIPNTWGVIFDHKYLKKLKGHITVFSSSRNVFAAALLYLGKNPNSTNKDDLKMARKLIEKSAKYWTRFDSDSYYRGLMRGDIWVSMSYSVDIYKTLQDIKSSNLDINLGAMMQKEGNMYELDNLVIPAVVNNLNYAYQFINIILKPSSAFALANFTGSSIPNKIAFAKLDPKLKEIDWIYPHDMLKAYTFNAYDPKTRIMVNEMWTEIQMQCHL
jgi:spermidine/putrescine transport system substrate-binding protein